MISRNSVKAMKDSEQSQKACAETIPQPMKFALHASKFAKKCKIILVRIKYIHKKVIVTIFIERGISNYKDRE